MVAARHVSAAADNRQYPFEFPVNGLFSLFNGKLVEAADKFESRIQLSDLYKMCIRDRGNTA